MTITGKQVRQLRSMANQLKATLIIGKDGVNTGAVKQANDALEAHELIKCNVLDGAGMSAQEAAYQLADAVEAEVIQVIGHKFVLYRESTREDIEKIELA
ncbi:MAG: YhbY family RNA-binding protein [Eggerthellaceae bacterium]|nr:YhbY family RNA-binding protein [Eggerthellaceae bacterium]